MDNHPLDLISRSKYETLIMLDRLANIGMTNTEEEKH